MDEPDDSGIDNPYEPEKKQSRKEWFIEQVKSQHGEKVLLPGGGSETSHLYEDLMGCFINGQFIACVILSASIVEHLLVLELGFTDFSYPNEEPTLGRAISDAENAGIVTENMDDLKWLNETRNGYVHFRDGRTDPSPTAERIQELDIGEFNPNRIGEEDARRAIGIAIDQQARYWEDFQKATERELDMDELYEQRRK
jgi:hypothetical protein